MGRKRNADTGLKGREPACPNNHTLKRLVAEGADYECDGCAAEIGAGSCYYGCVPCDHSLCASCYIKLATQNAAEEETVDVARKIQEEMAEFCDYYQLDDRCMEALCDVLRKRPDTYETDIWSLWLSLKVAKSRNYLGLVMGKVREMNNGTYVYTRPPKELERIIKQYHLDEDATDKLTDLICKRPDTADQDIIEIEKRFVNCNRPSSLCMTMIVALQRGTKLPEVRNTPPPNAHRDYAEPSKGHKGGGKDSGGGGSDRRRDRSRENDRYRDSDRGGSGGGGRGRDDHRRDRSRSYRRDQGGRSENDRGYERRRD